MKYLLIIFLVDGLGIPTEALTVAPVQNEVVCEKARVDIERQERFVRAICIERIR